ncbi:lipid III flippase WzxE [Actinobacillus arthritidis]|uniref:lipid III flippase WzxE n=1 Tax=Actinobacillus arthritidis TaxID=157339 RepID=UPI002442C11D|nr:lipid III flippase WzxE [Actinobacillus arthritidis]WGE89215.1 lipid III flippase WzxE [Actinobacillus arthritidis]
MKSLSKTAVWATSYTAFKIGISLILVKLFALQFGLEGLGQAANFMTLITVLGVFAGGGIFNGVTKYVAELEHSPEQLDTFLVTSNRIVVLFSAVLAVIFVLFSAKISEWIFYSEDYQIVIVVTALIQFAIANSNYLLAVLKGYRQVKANAISLIIGAFLSTIFFLGLLYCFGYFGGLIGIACMSAFSFLPASYFLKQRGYRFKFWLQGRFSWQYARNLSKFSAMVLITAMTLPITYIVLRDLLAESHSLEQVGLWQGVSKISDAYLRLITAVFSVYLLPTFAKLTQKDEIKREVVKAVKFVGVFVIGTSLCVFVLKREIILTLYSAQFLPIESLFIWQLIGDMFKVVAYVFGYLVVAKASLKLYILAEVCQLTLLLMIGQWLIPLNGAEGAVQTYLLTYFCYFFICLLAFHRYLKN